MPDAEWFDAQPNDDLAGIERDVPHLEMEVRRLRFAIRAAADLLDDGLRAGRYHPDHVHGARKTLEHALERRPDPVKR